MTQTRLRLALQKKGRLSSDSAELLQRCGVKIHLAEQKLIACAENLPLDLLRVRDDDIPGLVFAGVVDWGIVGENVLEEEELARRAAGEPCDYQRLCRLDFGHCRLALAVPQDAPFAGLGDLNGRTIATSYPQLLKQALRARGVACRTILLNGSVEVAPRAGLADAICDLVSSGATLEANGLREVEVIYRSQACLIQRAEALHPDKQALADKILTRIRGVQQAAEAKYIMLHAPRDRLEAITRLLPGVENPTLLPLAGAEDKVAVHAVSPENLFWETMEALRAEGASSILVLPIEKMLA